MIRLITRLAAKHLSRKAKRALESRKRLEKMSRQQMTDLLRDHGRRLGKLT